MRTTLFATTLLLPLLLGGIPASAWECSTRLGIALPQNDQISWGPALGLSAGVSLSRRILFIASIERSMHSLAAHQLGSIDTTTGYLGLEARLDSVPVVPVISLGPAIQYASRRKTGFHSTNYAAFLGLGLKSNFLQPLLLGISLRHLTSSFAASSFPSYSTFSVEIGWSR